MTDHELKIDREFEAALPALKAPEFNRLEMSLQDEGCRDPILIWANHDDTIVDGHNRYRICTRFEIPFKTKAMVFETRDEVLRWIRWNALGRRNLTPYESSVIVLALEPAIAEKAKEKQRKSGGAVVQKSGEPPIKTENELAALAGVSHDTIAKVKHIEAVAPEEVKRKLRDGETSVNAAYKELRREEQREAKRIELKAKAKANGKAASADWEIRQGDVLAELKKLSAGSARLIFADPPYNIGVDYGDGAKADKLARTEYMEWATAWLRDCKPILTDDGSLWVMIGDEYSAEYAVAIKSLGFAIRSWIKWYESFGVNCAKNFNRCSRHIFYCVANPDRFVFNAAAVNRPSDRLTKYNDKRADPGGKIWDDVWGINPPLPRLTGTCAERIPDFPTQLPLELLKAVVGCASKPGDLVVDPFSGSGTTGAAAIALGRRYVGIEKSAKFTKVSRLRLKSQKCEVSSETG